MGLVDLAKSLKARTVERVTPHRVVFHHVPKCAGTSVGRALRKRYLLSQATVQPEESFRAFEAFTGRTDREDMLVDVLDLRAQMFLYLLYNDVRCVSAHVAFHPRAHDLFKDRYRFITILREPVSRFISHYWWSHGRSDRHAGIPEDFDAFLETERARRIGATYVEYYCGNAARRDLASADAIQAACHNLDRFDVVGFLDDLPAFSARLKNQLGASFSIAHENSNKRAPAKSRPKLSDATLARVRDLCAPDLAVWEHACRARDAGQSNYAGRAVEDTTQAAE